MKLHPELKPNHKNRKHTTAVKHKLLRLKLHLCAHCTFTFTFLEACGHFLVLYWTRLKWGLAVPGRFVPVHFRSRERNDHIVDVSLRNCLVTFVLMNCRLQLSLYRGVGLLGSRYPGSTIMSLLTMTIAYV